MNRRGFRFVARVRAESAVEPARREERQRAIPGKRELVGRESELSQLAAAFRRAESGERQLVFVTGEAGIGKTSLVRDFLDRLLEREETGEPPWVGIGKCVELHGDAEAYLPILNALDRLARNASGAALRSTLARFAPTWLAQLPWLVSKKDGHPPHQASQHMTPTRMLRELCVALEEITRERTLVLWIEDLHWADPATTDLLAALARRPEPARLLVIGTYRPVDAALEQHPVAALKRSLMQREECQEMALELLDPQAVEAYLRGRFDRLSRPAELARVIHEQSDGNPLFMVVLANRLDGEFEGQPPETSAEFLRQRGTETLKKVVEDQIADLSGEESEVLCAASVAGSTFAAQSVAAALDVEELAIEKVCGRLADIGLFLEDAGGGSWPDGSTGQLYAFHHDVLRHCLYERIPAARRQNLHARIAERLAAGYAAEPGVVASQLAVHFERGGDAARAVDWLERAAAGVRHRFAEREAVVYLEGALELLATSPRSDHRCRRELDLRLELAEVLMFAAGLASDSSVANLERGLETAKALEDARAAMTVLASLARAHWFRSELATAEARLADFFALEDRVEDRALRSFGHANAEFVALMKGDLPRTSSEAAAAWKLIAEEENPGVPFVTSDPAVQTLSCAAVAEWLSGRPAGAEATSQRILKRARAAGDPYRLMATLIFRGELAVYSRALAEVDLLSAEVARIRDEFGFGVPFAYRPAYEGWRLWQHGDADAAIACLEEGLATTRKTGVRMNTSFLLATLAEVRLARGEADAGLAAIGEGLAFAEETGERYLEAELHRLRGELLLLEPRPDAAEEAFQRALEIARRQGARSLELGAASSQARLWQRQGRKDEARDLLAPVYAGFTEGLETPALQDAKALLDSL